MTCSSSASSVHTKLAIQVDGKAIAQGDSSPPLGGTAWPRVADMILIKEGEGVTCVVFAETPADVGSSAASETPAASKLSLLYKQPLFFP